MSNLDRNLSAFIIGSSQGMWRAPFHTDGLDMCWLGLLLGFAMPDVLQTVGIKNWLLTVDTKILDIGWMLLKTGAGENLIWTTSSASAGFECKINFVYIVQFVHISFLFYACAQWGSPFLVYRLDSARLSTPHRTHVRQLGHQAVQQFPYFPG